MGDPAEKSQENKSVRRWWSNRSKRVGLPGLEGLTFHDLWVIFYTGIVKGTFSTRASAISYSFFMALFPFLLFMLNLIPFITFIEDFQIQFLIFMDEMLPAETRDFFNDIFLDIAAKKRVGLLSTVFLLSMILMANGVNAIFTSFEFSFHTRYNRSIIRQYFVAFGVSLILALLFLIIVISVFYLTYLMEDINEAGILSSMVSWVNFGRFIMLSVLIYIGVATLYYFGTKEGRLSRFFSVGAIFSSTLMVLTTFLFSLYIENFSNYNEIYGSIGALLILMIYIWINSNILLLGFELNASLLKLRKK